MLSGDEVLELLKAFGLMVTAVVTYGLFCGIGSYLSQYARNPSAFRFMFIGLSMLAIGIFFGTPLLVQIGGLITGVNLLIQLVNAGFVPLRMFNKK